ncbi:polymorphic toxin type 44 domain-containing protein [Solidesulfovibrio alcoholivorans]|uniref:polymorphic toxin type 44 domain-containing protein n=1 Tax=Solidesulfovibrio alcoholivorans TaxID=81406 RepID=UPI00138E392C|nr:polymorphic toxin type 44 domain-containing protein [Solidesulfovibrio alcoholivorans]
MARENYGEVEGVEPKAMDAFSETLLEISTFYVIQNKIMKIRYGTMNKRDEDAGYIDPNFPPLKIPAHPSDADIDANIKKARESFNPYWFVEMVMPKGAWDYKRKDPEYENFGNFNFGATAKAFGFQEKWALQAAGIVQIYQHKSVVDYHDKEYCKALLDFKEAFQGAPYGDEKKDQEMIKLGFRYYEDVYLPKYGSKHTTKEDIITAIKRAEESSFPLSNYIVRQLQQLRN